MTFDKIVQVYIFQTLFILLDFPIITVVTRAIWRFFPIWDHLEACTRAFVKENAVFLVRGFRCKPVKLVSYQFLAAKQDLEKRLHLRYHKVLKEMKPKDYGRIERIFCKSRKQRP